MPTDGPVRFYIVHGGGITPSSYVPTSPFALVQKNWRDALPALVREYPNRGDGLEIDSHGNPGIVYLEPQVNFGTLAAFVAAVRGLLRPHALVEFLACRVSNYDVAALIGVLKSDPYRKADVELLTAWLANSDALRYGDGRGVKLHISSNPVTRAAPVPVANLDHARVMQLAIQAGQQSIGQYYNGPLFCTRFAKALGCRVRAAMSRQPGAMTSGMGVQEFLNTPTYRVMPIGSWVGHVFDFEPGGGVTYIGHNVPRGVFVPIVPGEEGSMKQV